MLRWLTCCLVALCALPALAQTPLSELPLGNAASFTEETHVIVTARLPNGVADTAYAEVLAERYGVSVVAVWPLNALQITCFVFVVQGDVDRLVQEISTSADVVDAYAVKSFETFTDASYRDEYVQIQDALWQMQVLPIHTKTTGEGVVIALIDTAVAISHRDLAGQKVKTRNFVSRASVDAVAERHGTAMAALILADARNGVGMVGVAPDAEMMALRACWETGQTGKGVCNTFSLARALNFAILNGADVINLSLTGPEDPILRKLIVAALKKDISVVLAAARDDGPALAYDLPGVVFASSTSSNSAVLAPGKEILSAMPVDDYDFYSGSSVSTAHISGALALLRALKPSASAGELGASLAVASRYGQRTVDLCMALNELDNGSMGCNR